MPERYAPSVYSPGFSEWFRQKQGLLFVERLPSYSPDYNPIEKLWKKTKKDATHLKYFPDFDSLRLSVLNAFNKYMNDATKIISVMKKLRNEAKINYSQLELFN